MGFFKSSTPPPAQQPVVIEEKKGLFGRKKTVVHDPNKRNSIVKSPTTASELSPTSPTSPISPTSPSSHVTRLDEINTAIPAAREKVRLAEEAENRARIALKEAEAAVIEARRHVAALESEAKEQARLAELAAREAQIKLREADSLAKKTNKMGRI